MAVTIRCACGKMEDVPDSCVGTRMRCRACDARIIVGQPAFESPPNTNGTLSYAGAERGNIVISRDRMLAGRSCTAWGVLMFIFPTCAGLVVIESFGRPGTGVRSEAISAGVVLLLSIAYATAYLLCGVHIRRGGMISSIVCLVLASLQFAVSALAVVYTLIMALTQSPVAFIGMLICLLFAAAVGQLVIYLIKILRQPRPF